MGPGWSRRRLRRGFLTLMEGRDFNVFKHLQEGVGGGRRGVEDLGKRRKLTEIRKEGQKVGRSERQREKRLLRTWERTGSSSEVSTLPQVFRLVSNGKDGRKERYTYRKRRLL